MIRNIDRRHLSWLALAFVAFAAAGASNTAVEADVESAVAVASVVVGCYALARYAARVSRTGLATGAVGLWIAFLAVSGLHVVGLDALAAAAPGSTPVALAVLEALTWTTLLGASVSTAFLAFREYGAGTTATEDVFDGEADY